MSIQINTQKIETARETLTINGEKISMHRLVGASATEIVKQMMELGMDDHKIPRLPGPNPVSIERKDFEKLKTKKYVIAEKTDGVRFIMMFTRLFGFKVCTIIDRSMSSYLVPLKAIPRVLFQGTLFDGELTIDKQGKKCFILFDAVVVSGVTVSQLDLGSRLVAMRRGLKDFKMHPADPVELRMKAWTELGDVNAAKSKIAEASNIYHTDGVVLVPKDDPVFYGRNFDFFKMKPQGTHTVDFILMDNNGTIGIYDPRSKRDVAIGKVSCTYQAGVVVECEIVNNAWRVVGVRTDKNQSNDMLTYEKTMLNIRENIQLHELFNL
jgi:hypothetical protein